MNKQEKINTALRLVSRQYRLDKNSIRVNTHNTYRHELAKFKKCWEFMKEGYEVYTEVVFRDHKGRADIFIPELFQVFEILESESLEKFEAKRTYYPSELELVYERAEDILK